MKLDARGKACPQPVVMAMKQLSNLQEDEILEVLVDNETAVENLRRMAEEKGYLTRVSEQGTDFQVCFLKNASASPQQAVSLEKKQEGLAEEKARDTVVVIGTDSMGQGDVELGRILVKGYVYALTQLERVPETLILFNGGARLAAEGSLSLEDLRILEEAGTDIIVCGTCAEYFAIKEEIEIGRISNMYEIAEKMANAGHLVRI